MILYAVQQIFLLEPDSDKKSRSLIFTCLKIDPANALVDALSFCVMFDFSLTQVTADAVSEALTSAWTSILFLQSFQRKRC